MLSCSQQATSGGPGAPGGRGYGPSSGEQIQVKVPNNKVWSESRIGRHMILGADLPA
jgi:hypothetical protein